MFDKFMYGSKLLSGSNTIPGEQLTDSEKELFSIILKACKNYGFDFFPTVIQKLNYDEMSEIVSYGAFPVRYQNWRWGMAFEKLQKTYETGNQRIFEVVRNSSPCVMYLLNSNTILDNLIVVAHATGHNDFFKNNIYFEQTNRNADETFANHAARIKRYINRWGPERITEFIDHVHRIETLIDPEDAWLQKENKDYDFFDKAETEQPRRFEIDKDRDYLYPYLNTNKFKKEENDRIKRNEIIKELDILTKPEKNIFKYIKDNAELKPWQQDIIAMLYDEAMYFLPQRQTKATNEGWAMFANHEIMARQGYAGLGQKHPSGGIIDYAKTEASILGGRYSMNPYKLGFSLLLDIEERWNKGQFGTEWEECKNAKEKENWDKKLNLGKSKIFEVRKYYNDVTLLLEFFTQEFCDKFEFFEWKKYEDEYRIETRDCKVIKKKLLQKYVNGGLPDIRMTDDNHLKKGILFLEHLDNDRPLYEYYARETLCSLWFFWRKQIVLSTKNKKGEDIVFICDGMNSEKDIITVSENDYLRHI